MTTVLANVTWFDHGHCCEGVNLANVFLGYVTQREPGSWEFEHRGGHQTEPIYRNRTAATLALLHYHADKEALCS